MVAPPPSAPPALVQTQVVLPAGFERVRLPARISAGRALDPAGDLDGLVGTSLLRCFDLYLDYPRSRVLLVPDPGARGTQCP